MRSYKLTADDVVRLPVGIIRDGVRVREVIIDEFRAVDKESLTSASAKENPQKAITNILTRVLQEVPGVLPRKKGHLHRFSDVLVNEMTTADRDTIMYQALLLGDDDERVEEIECPHCKGEVEVIYNLTDLDIFELEDEDDTFVEFNLPRGIRTNIVGPSGEPMSALIKKGKLRLLTGKDAERLGKQAKSGEFALLNHQLALCSFDVDHIGTLTYEDVQGLGKKDSDYLIDLLGNKTPGPDTIRKETCPHCLKEFDHGMNVSRFFM